MKSLITFIAVLALTACSQQPKHQAHPTASNKVIEYHYQDSSGDWLWYYFLYSNILGGAGNQSHLYYYNSPTRLTGNDYSAVPFRSGDKLTTEELAEASSASQNIDAGVTKEVSVEEVPDNIQAMEQEEVNQAYQEYEQEQNANDSNNDASEHSESTETSSSESSSSDSGGGDSGGSSDSGGGGGGE